MTLVHLTVKESRTLRGRGLRKYVKRITNVNFSKLPYFIKIWQRKSLPTLVGWG